ncbi:MAG: hypothetical protein A3D10_05260 [Omnitrophica WOR_2 bacterium RIFCSPHIGHO2_02_FULL_48_11]|nr:MAG: hypothetical protein A3D10_05260 [Omnitrophica WOR_2 bacterium RIFCSPHIGHO2_02_FULL_48_11]
MLKKIAIATSSFGQFDVQPLKILEKNGFSFVLNKEGRTLKREELLTLAQGCLGVIAGTEPYNQETLEYLPDLRIISRCGSGTDNLDLQACERRGIKTFKTSDGPQRAVAELVVGLILNVLRQLSLMDRELRRGIWQKRMGSLLLGKNVGIIGLGQVGTEVAFLLKAMGTNICYFDPWTDGKTAAGFVRQADLYELLKVSDIVSLHVPLTEKTKYLIGEKELAAMPKQAILINCSRGGIVDETALYQALQEKKLAGAAVDVFEQEPYQGPLVELDNVLLTPHIGSYAKEARIKMEVDAVNNLLSGLNG